jgi:hypothetical protein
MQRISILNVALICERILPLYLIKQRDKDMRENSPTLYEKLQ